MKKFIVKTMAMSVVLALIVVAVVSQRTYEEHSAKALAVQTEVLSDVEADHATFLEALSADVFGRPGYEAAQIYPKQMEKLFELGINQAELDEILNRYHYRYVIPILYLYATNKSILMTSESTISDTVATVRERIKSRNMPKRSDFSIAKLSDTERMHMALQKIKEDGNSFLARFDLLSDSELGEDVAQMQYAKAGSGMVGNFFLDGVYNLEKKYHRGEATVKDAAWAAVDAAVIIGSVKALKSLKAVKGARVAHTGSKVRAVSSRLMPAWVKTGAKITVIGGAIYLTVNHPGVLLSGLGVIAESFGIPGVLAIFAVVLFVLWPIIMTGTGLALYVRRFWQYLRKPVPSSST